MSESEKAFFEYIDLALEEHENFQNGFEDARTAFNETFEDHEPFDIADHAHYSAYKEFEQQLASEKAAHAETKRQRDELLSDIVRAYERIDSELRGVRRVLVQTHNNDDPALNTENLRAHCLVLASKIGLELDAVNPWNMKPQVERARQAIKKVRGEV